MEHEWTLLAASGRQASDAAFGTSEVITVAVCGRCGVVRAQSMMANPRAPERRLALGGECDGQRVEPE
jgi:hypothetical protein